MVIRTCGGSCSWVTQFTLTFSTNGVDRSDVDNESGTIVVFEGNTDATTMVSNPLLTTWFVQLMVISIHGSEAELKWAID